MQGEGEALPSSDEDQAGQDGQRDRHHHPELAAETDFGSNLDPASDRLHAGPHDVEPDAATRDVRHELRSGKPRPEHQLHDVVVAELSHVDALAYGAAPVPGRRRYPDRRRSRR